jgi:hypothetical protein
MVPLGFLEITVKNEVPTTMFLLGTLFLTVISRETWRNLLHIIYYDII